LNTFEDQLAVSEPGDEIIYHKGFHCMAPTTYPKRNAAAKSAWDAYERGEVLLYQRRIGQDMLEYCAKVIR